MREERIKKMNQRKIKKNKEKGKKIMQKEKESVGNY